jgi:hypothetical protein
MTESRSNIEPERNLQAAVGLLWKRCEVLALSSVYPSPPCGVICWSKHPQSDERNP